MFAAISSIVFPLLIVTPQAHAHANICGAAIPPAMQQIRLHVESYYKTEIRCEPKGAESELVQGKPVLRLTPGLPDKTDIAIHELMHMQLWTEGYPRGEDACPESVFPYDPKQTSALCFPLRELLTHRLLSRRLTALGLSGSESYDRELEESQKAIDSEIDRARQKGRTSLNVDLAYKSVLLAQTKYEATAKGWRSVVTSYRRLNMQKAVEVSEKLNAIIDREKPDAPQQFRPTIAKCLLTIAQAGILGTTPIPLPGLTDR